MQKLLHLISFSFIFLNLNSQTITVNPNPVYQNALLSYTLASADSVTIIVSDITGKVVLTPRTKSFLDAGVYQDSLLMETLQNGIYYVLLKTPLAKSAVTKVIKTISSNIPINNNFATIKLFPNPFHDKLTLESDLMIEGTEVILFSPTGKEIYNASLNSKTTEFDLSDLPSGIYFMKLENSKNQKVFKIMKE